MRYQVKNESVSVHCCFEATVLDTQTVDEIGYQKTMCECFDLKDAQSIADALNREA